MVDPTPSLEQQHSQSDVQLPVPRIGMSFVSEEEVRSYYIKYGKNVGFSIRRSCTKIGDDGNLKYFSFSCSRSRKPTYTSNSNTSFRLRPSIRTDCKAKINIVVANDGRLVLSKVRLDHNHPLLTPPNPQPQYITYNGQEQQPTNAHFHYIVSQTQLQLSAGDAQAIQTYFLRMQQNTAKFFHLMDFNDNGCLRNVFWADSRSRAAYHEFGDVVLLDTTFLSNNHDVPFVALLGVNHHGHSILLATALLSSQDVETYLWLFRSWLTCISGRPPKAIITEWSEALREAVSLVFPDARHRWCLWHLMKTIPEKLEGLAQCQTIRKVMKNIVYDSLTPSDFEEKWRHMIEKYNLAKNEWLEALYAVRHHWVPVFVKDTFWAGITVAQCCENMNGFFDGFVNCKTPLKEFLVQYDTALKSKVEKENKADITSLNATVPLFSDLYMEKQFREVYTHENFKLFQEELRGLLYCNTSFVKIEELISTYQVVDSVKVKDDAPRKEVAFEVTYDEARSEVNCLCRSFEFRGILCRHAVAVFIKRNIHEIPPHYILSRWRKDVRRRHSLVKISYNDSDSNPRMQRYDQLSKIMDEIAELGVESDEKCKLLTEYMDEVKEKFLRNDWICLVSPSELCFPPTKRKEVSAEQSAGKKKKKGKQIQSVDDNQSHVEAVQDGSQLMPGIDPPHSWSLNTGVVATHPNFLQNQLEECLQQQIYAEQPKDMGFVEFTNNCTHWTNFNSGPLLLPAGFEGTGDTRYSTRGDSVDHLNRTYDPTQNANADVRQAANMDLEQSPLGDATIL